MAVATETQFHVLAVDDSIIDRKLIERLLRTSSFQVESGSKALEFLGLLEGLKNPPSAPAYQTIDVNMVITDYCMPGMTGCLEEGAEEFLLKPVKLSDMNKLMPRILRGKSKEHLLQSNIDDGFSLCCSTVTGENNSTNSTNLSGNKRKVVDDDELSPERKMPRLCCDL